MGRPPAWTTLLLPRGSLRCNLYAPAAIRTRDLRLRRPTLYPAELLARASGRFWRFCRSVEVGGGLGQPPLTFTNLDQPPPAFFSVGASGFEPPTSWSRTRRANRAALRPEVRPRNLEADQPERKPGRVLRSARRARISTAQGP